MPICKRDLIGLSNCFHLTVREKKGTATAQVKFFLYSETRIIILHSEDISLQKNLEIHQNLTDKIHIPQKNWLITSPRSTPERVGQLIG